jgi:hypothetical protein
VVVDLGVVAEALLEEPPQALKVIDNTAIALRVVNLLM